MTKNRIEYEVIAEPEDTDSYTAIILRIDGQEFELDKRDVSDLEGIIVTVFDWMIDPFDTYLRREPTKRLLAGDSRACGGLLG
jgi:hypothetical protein